MNQDFNIIYKVKTATEKDIQIHLTECNDSFIPPLNSRINLNEYARKIANYATTFEAWQENLLIGLIAAYFTNTESGAFITNVSIYDSFKGKNVASILLSNCKDYALTHGFAKINLEVNQHNAPAINFYKKHNFISTHIKENSIFLSYTLTHS